MKGTYLIVLGNIVVLSGLNGCAKTPSEPESEGVIARIAGEVRALSPEESQLCGKTLACEPNYIWKIDGAKKKPAPRRETQDYSRAILKLPDAWKITQGSREVVVAVIDTGVDVKHPDLADNIWVNEKEKAGKSGADDDGNGYIDDVYGWNFANNRPNAIDDNKHGTHCAGIIAAEMNGFGSVGVAPKVRIMPLKFMSASGAGDTESAIKAVNYAIDNGAQVISNSWGGGAESIYLREAFQMAIERGILVVAAAGNNGMDNDAYASYPASYPGVIAVASTDENDQLSGFSNYGLESVWISAPGSHIFSTVPGGRYESLSGTSMAAPQVSGAVALALSLKKSLSPDTIKEELCKSADPATKGSVRCGRMNVQSFVESISRL